LAKVKIELLSPGMRQLLNDPGVAADLLARAHRVAAAAGPGHGVDVDRGAHGRARARVWTRSFDAMEAEAKDRNLTRAFNAARG
jgi:hypothetical protein